MNFIKKITVFMAFIFAVALPSGAKAEEFKSAVYLGINDYNTQSIKKVNSFSHRFFIDNEIKNLKVSSEDDFKILNILEEGEIYDIIVENNYVVNAEKSKVDYIGVPEKYPHYLNIAGSEISRIIISPGNSKVENNILRPEDTIKVVGDKVFIVTKTHDYLPVVSGEPGVRTLKNFIKTSFTPVGHTLYVYGGLWNFEDDGGSDKSSKIGLDKSYTDFFFNSDANYNYRAKNKKSSYYPEMKYNQYRHLGMDCSGFVGWTIYNTIAHDSGFPSYVEKATTMANSLAYTYGLGTKARQFKPQDFKPGDIFSMSGHIYISLGACDDGSILILHSSPTPSYKKSPGGGVQLSALGAQNSEAHKLAAIYMNRYYPEWSSRYPVSVKSYKSYTGLSNPVTGKFSWNLDETGLLDPDGYINLKPREILRDIFNEEHVMTDVEIEEVFKNLDK